MHRSNHRVLCTIAGFDPTGGAGIDVDRAVFEAFGAEAKAVVTVETEQDEGGVRRLGARDPAVVAEELARILREDDPAALKLGALGTLAIVEAIAAVLEDAPPRPVVFDPVLEASSGGALLEPEAIPQLAPLLEDHVTLLTPNLPEAATLLGRRRPATQDFMAPALCKQGWEAVLLKGGHGEDPEHVRDVAFDGPRLGDLLWSTEGRRLQGPELRGTGCALASAIAARLGFGEDLVDAMDFARTDLEGWMADALAAERAVLPPLRAVRLAD